MGRPTVAEVDLSALRFNATQIRKLLDGRAEILAIVKADAYGHGAVAAARALSAAGVNLFGVASTEEALELRQAGVSLPVLVLAGIDPRDGGEIIRHRLTPVLFDLPTARDLDALAGKAGERISVHLKVDTGMTRLGFSWREWEGALRVLRELAHLRVEGIMSHFSVAESAGTEDRSFTGEQLRRFQSCLDQARQAGLSPRYVHLANSAATALWGEARFNLVRPGLMLYGEYPAPCLREAINLHPVLRWKTQVLSLKKVPAGDTVSYGRTFCCGCESRIATIPAGYADGYSRSLSNRGEVLVRGRRVRVAGVVCMDLTMIDVTDVPEVEPGEEVVLLGKQGTEEITASEMARWMGTIPYEVLCGIGKRVPRVYLP